MPPDPALPATRRASEVVVPVIDELAAACHPREVGPGVYDIHSPRILSATEATTLPHKGLEVIPSERLRVNPDCGLKTRGRPEVRASPENLVTAARQARSTLTGTES